MVALYIQRLWCEYTFQSSFRFRPKDAVLGVLGGLRAVRRGSEAELWSHFSREVHRALARAARHLPHLQKVAGGGRRPRRAGREPTVSPSPGMVLIQPYSCSTKYVTWFVHLNQTCSRSFFHSKFTISNLFSIICPIPEIFHSFKKNCVRSKSFFRSFWGKTVTCSYNVIAKLWYVSLIRNCQV